LNELFIESTALIPQNPSFMLNFLANIPQRRREDQSVNKDELNRLKRQLVNKDYLNKEYIQYWGSAFNQMRNEASNHSEFPTSAKILDYVRSRIEQDSESYVKELPLEIEAITQALIMMMVKNNQRILQVLETYTKPNAAE
jgi:hypothetical protein